MSSKIDICNRSLTILGADTIMSLTEDSKNARRCNVLYDEVRESVLRDHPWNCVTRQSSLAQLTDTPTFDWEYAYSLPSDSLRVLNTYENSNYAIYGKKLYSDESTVSINYISNIDDPQQYDSLLREALSLFLAYKLAYAITQSTSLAQEMYQLYQNALVRARGADAKEGTAPIQRATRWARAHMGNSAGFDSDDFTVS